MLSIKNVFKWKEGKDSLERKFSFEEVKKYTEDSLERLRRYESDISDLREFKKMEHKRRTLLKVAQNCGKGDIAAKEYMKRYITDLITINYGINENNIDLVLNFNSPENVEDKFYIILFKYKKKYRYEALTKLLQEYRLDEFREINGDMACTILSEDIEKIFHIEKPLLTFEDKLNILVQKIYQETKGLGVIDELRDMFSDGLSLGVSGVPADFIGKLSDMEIRQNIDTLNDYNKSYESIWLYYNGKEIHLKFLSFGSQHELERVCRLIYRYHDAPSLTRSDGYGFNYMADLSRVAVFRPPFVEGWCAFIRKFDRDPELDTLFKGENYDIVKEFLHYLGRGKQKVVITGQQGTGKTTLLIAIIRRMYSNVTLRVWEDYFEAFLRLKMPNRNIMTIRKTAYIKGEKGIDALKKSNGQVTIITEAAEDEHIKYIVKVSEVASETILYTHHANNIDSLVSSLRNGAVNTGAFTNEDIAEAEVLKTLGFDVHLKKTPDGKRYIERITEFIIEDDGRDMYEELINVEQSGDVQQQNKIMFEMIKEIYIANSKTRKRYKAVDIIRYDMDSGRYIVVNKLSDKKKKAIMNNLLLQDKSKFKAFIITMENLMETEVN
ncbi:ATPase, T2SS/T4P/T4SS family [Clostridium oryzae]|uniref:Type II/IV secretion system protein n=1 Tax=Clostridium oryzae TaxID=1450648 RepID=A0A1V4IJT7_9CLOT|nr:ATPase, T2SS/T4P/T4SS family [Clostridium oryzae]OPJ59767.1 type II/IV secretion system protein [Clostridium oryzae]